MKKSSIIVLTVVAVIALLAVIYRAVNNAPSASLTANEQVVQVLTDGGCASCHSMAPDLPFYAHFPVIKGMINKHVQEGYATFDILPFMRTMKDESVPNEVDLNKVEQCIIDGARPSPLKSATGCWQLSKASVPGISTTRWQHPNLSTNPYALCPTASLIIRKRQL